MTTDSPNQIPRTAYGLVMLVATLVAIATSWLVADRLGGNPATIRTLLFALGVGSVATLFPIVLRIGKDHWGVCVLASGMGRALIVLGYCYLSREANPEVLSRPLFLGAASGAIFLLLVEVVASIKILSTLERRRPMPGAADAHTLSRKPA